MQILCFLLEVVTVEIHKNEFYGRCCGKLHIVRRVYIFIWNLLMFVCAVSELIFVYFKQHALEG